MTQSPAATATQPDSAAARPAFCSIDDWCHLTGMGRRWTYDKLGTGELKAIKVSSRVLIDVEAGLAWLRSHPAPQIRAPRAPTQHAA
jgi:hypothetical protein